jgi:hypothetical protein
MLDIILLFLEHIYLKSPQEGQEAKNFMFKSKNILESSSTQISLESTFLCFPFRRIKVLLVTAVAVILVGSC